MGLNWLYALGVAVLVAVGGGGLGTVGSSQRSDDGLAHQGPGRFLVEIPKGANWTGEGQDTKCTPDPKTEECPGFANLDE